MGNPQIAEALFAAHVSRATGWLTCTAQGRESRLGFRDGDLVQVEMRFGFQTPTQALVQAGRIEPFQLDALWARGEAGTVEAETLEELGVTPRDAEAAQALASVRRVLQLADSARFEEGRVEGDGLVSGAWVVRAAWETLPLPSGEAPYFRLRAAEALDGWAVTDEERAWLQASSELRSADGLPASRRALLEVLAKGGALEWVPAEEFRRRKAEERARREAEERARREAEERARREAEEQARREAEEQARREAEERARREAEEQARREAEDQARREAEERARREAEEQARREAEERARREAEERARREADEAARLETERAAAQRVAEATRLKTDEEERREEEERFQRQAMLRAEEESRRDEEEAELEAARARAELARCEAEEASPIVAKEAAPRQVERLAEPTARGTAEDAARAAAEEEAWAREEAELLAKAQAVRRARQEEEARRAAEEERRRQEEAARLAEEARRREEEEEAELLRRAEAARLARLRPEPDELARRAEVRQAADTFVGPPPQPSTPTKSLLERMNEALRQSAIGLGSSPVPVTRADSAPQRSRDERIHPHVQVPPEPPTQRRPLVFGGQGAGVEEADLWNIVQPANPKDAPPSAVQSFEEALRRVDSSLEALVGEVQPSQDTLVEPIIEAEVQAPSPLAPVVARLEDFDVGDPSDPAEAARLRRQRLLRRAMENLGVIPQPQHGQPPRVENVQVVEPQAPGPSPTSPTPSSPTQTRSPTPADLQLAAQIEARFEGLAKKDHFAVLGLTPNATRDQVKSAFLSLAKVFHPDRLPPTLPHLAHKMSAVFEAIRTAYETLYDDSRRASYAASLTAGAPPPPAAPVQQAAELMKMAEVFFKKRDYRQAEQHFLKAHALDKGAASLAAAAWAVYMDPSRKAEAGQARALMQKALAIDPNCDRAHYQLGVIARVEGDMDAAERHFREAVRINPRHLEANQEIRLIELRKKKDAEKKGSGFFR